MINTKAHFFLDLLAKFPVVDVWVRTDRLNTDTVLPAQLMGKEFVQLQYGLNLAFRIRDLYVGEGAVTGTLRFGYDVRFTRVCWDDVFMITADQRGQVFDEEYALRIAPGAKPEAPRVGRLHKKSGFRVIDGGKSPTQAPAPKGAA